MFLKPAGKNSVRQERKVYDLIYGQITFPKLIWEFIDTPEFQRLRKIKQLTCCSYVYPSTIHTRFQHSLGTAHLAKTYITTLIQNHKKHPDINEQVTKSYADQQKNDLYIFIITLAGLLHDIGHATFSHLFDASIVRKVHMEERNSQVDWEHEIASLKIIECLYQRVIKNLKEKDPEWWSPKKVQAFQETQHRVKALIIGKIRERKWQVQPKQKYQIKDNLQSDFIKRFESQLSFRTWQFQLISNRLTGIDVDKLDYFRRDAHYAGFKNIHIYQELLMNEALVLQDKDPVPKRGQIVKHRICYPSKYQDHVNEIFYARYKLHKNLYKHPKVNGIELMIIDALKILDKQGKFKQYCQQLMKGNITNYLKLTDSIVQCEETKKILQAIEQRKIYQFKCEYSGIYSLKQIQTYNLIDKKRLNKQKQLIQSQFPGYFIYFAQLSFGLKDINPLQECRYYKKQAPSVIKGPKSKVFLKPQQILQYTVRIYCQHGKHKTETLNQIHKKLKQVFQDKFSLGETQVKQSRQPLHSKQEEIMTKQEVGSTEFTQ